MSQFDFGTMDPYVVDGVQLADSLNQWRDALHSMHRAASRPPYAVAGMMWINDSAGAANWVVNIYMGATVGDKALFSYDTTTGAVTWNSGIPAGVMWDYGGTVAPPGFYACDGSLKSRTTDSLLFAAISTAYGSGDGSTTFALPDCRGRVTAMLDSGTGRLTTVANTMGATGGVDKYALLLAEIAAHTHAGVDHLHAMADHSHPMSDHYHQGANGGQSVLYANVGAFNWGNIVSQTGNLVAGYNGVGLMDAARNTAGMDAARNTGAADRALTTSSTGSGTAHQNTQPTIIINKIIKR
jgi:microcystin-dependent protein